MPRRRTLRVFQIAALAVFLLHAATYLYFFVDDEGIPYRYAQNLLAGNGLTYDPAEGRVEGYSDFLHVILGTGILGITRVLHLPPISVFFIGKIISLAAGVAIVWLAGLTLARLRQDDARSLAATLVMVALAGPLAVWSCSSLEAVPFALGVSALAYALCGEVPLKRLALLAAIFLALDRTDGWVWAGGLGAGYLLFGSREQRRVAFWSVLVPAGMVTVGMEVFRLAYFGIWAPMPVFAKVLFKLQNAHQIVVKSPAQGYAASFASLYGTLPLIAAALVGLVGAIRQRELRGLLAAVVMLAAYVSVVGDWMFGFRFFVPLVAPAAIVVGASLARWPKAVGWALALGCIGWSLVTARDFERLYTTPSEVDVRENFWRTRSFEVERFFARYYSLVEFLRPLVPPGTLIAYNQAGLVSFLLDAPNIDNLGICSRFYAELPSDDVAYTEVGRFAPLTAAPIIDVRRAYLLNRAPRFLIEAIDMIRHSNDGRIPESLLGGRFLLVGVDAARRNVVYRWAGLPNERYTKDADAFLQNVAHVSLVDRAIVDHTVLEGAAIPPALRFLQGGRGTVMLAPEYSLTLRVRDDGATARQLYLGQVKVDRDVELEFTFRAADGRITYHAVRALPAGAHRIDEWLPSAVPVHVIDVRLRAAADAPVRARLTDLRVMGQTPRLLKFVKTHVRFQGAR